MRGNFILLLLLFIPIPIDSQITTHADEAIIGQESENGYEIVVVSLLPDLTIKFSLVKLDTSGNRIQTVLLFETKTSTYVVDMYRYSDGKTLIMFIERESFDNEQTWEERVRLILLSESGNIEWDRRPDIGTGLFMEILPTQLDEPRLVFFNLGFVFLYTIDEVGNVEQEIKIEMSGRVYMTTLFLDDQYACLSVFSDDGIKVERRMIDPSSGDQVSLLELPIVDVFPRSVIASFDGFLLIGENIYQNETYLYREPGYQDDYDFITIPRNDDSRSADFAIPTVEGTVLWSHIYSSNQYYTFTHVSLFNEISQPLTLNTTTILNADSVFLNSAIPIQDGVLAMGRLELADDDNLEVYLVKLSPTGDLTWEQHFSLSFQSDRSRISITFSAIIAAIAIRLHKRSKNSST